MLSAGSASGGPIGGWIAGGLGFRDGRGGAGGGVTTATGGCDGASTVGGGGLSPPRLAQDDTANAAHTVAHWRSRHFRIRPITAAIVPNCVPVVG